MASRRMGVVALASACLAGSLAWSGVPAIASNSQAAPATTANETPGDEAGVTLLLRLSTHGRRCARWTVGVADIGALVTRLGGRARGHGWY